MLKEKPELSTVKQWKCEKPSGEDLSALLPLLDLLRVNLVHIEDLSVYRWNTGFDGAKVICDALKTNTSLTKLDVSRMY